MKKLIIFSLSIVAMVLLMTGCGHDDHRDEWRDNRNSEIRQDQDHDHEHHEDNSDKKDASDNARHE